MGQLTVKAIASLVAARSPGLHAHGRGLYLAIGKSGSATWTFRYTTREGKRRLMTLEGYSPAGTTAATLKAVEAEVERLREVVKAGDDPLAERGGPAEIEQRSAGLTFKEAALDYIAANKGAWKNEKHAQQWENTLASYVYPHVGDKPVHTVTTTDVKAILEQPHSRNGKTGTLWSNARETASRVRSRIEIVISAAKALGLGDKKTAPLWINHRNPAQWKDNLNRLLNGKQAKSHFKAMDWNDVPAFMSDLLAKTDYSARALALTILCATRTNETINATWSEVDLKNAVWTIPAARMKAGREHRVPLSTIALELLNQVPRVDANPYVFPGARAKQPLSNMAMLEMLRGMRGDGLTVHGFRSAFRDWITETTVHPDVIAEQALAHTINDKTVAAYRRGDAFERRKKLMQQWADYLTVEGQAYANRWSTFLA
ncbi:site-specific integrase [Sphingomonas sp. MA1305]|uniref:tyrosine-type recombinase/integrase n=1 Tax=Sphingomonas sp. MA1305 TaxID=2479204 RepID=UPI0018DFC50B|nr:site-specific integrase [Sphingomonas sp. MA1305]MBI0476112.1 site-specific integrase [Sphingomonas sp. MA1305]